MTPIHPVSFQAKESRIKKASGKSKLAKLTILLLAVTILAIPLTCTAGRYTNYTLTIEVNDEAGGSTSPFGAQRYYHGNTVTVTAHANEGYTFGGWYLNGEYVGNLTTTTVTMYSDYTLQAIFLDESKTSTPAPSPAAMIAGVPAESFMLAVEILSFTTVLVIVIIILYLRQK